MMLGEDDQPMWNSYLYLLQEEAPRPKPVYCRIPEIAKSRPPYFGDEYHGPILREEGEARCREEGNFLIRESTERGRYVLVLRILGVVKNFRLYWEKGQHFVGDKKFPNINALVEDGLITMYVEGKAEDYIKNMSQTRNPIYSSLSRSRQFLSQRSTPHVPDPRNYPPRDQAVVMIGEEERNSPRHAHNGRDTEEAALPYPYNPQPVMENKPLAPTHFHNPAFTNGPTEPKSYYNSSITPQPSRSIIKSLTNTFSTPTNHIQSMNIQPSMNPPNVTLHPTMGGGGTKKNLTPTSSDERKRTKAKKIATDDYRVAQYPYVDSSSHFPMQVNDHKRSSSNSSTSTSDSEGYRGLAGPNHQPSAIRGQQFNHSFSGGCIVQSSPDRRHSPMRRNNSDPTQKQMPYRLKAAHHFQTNMAHVRQLSGGSTSGSSVTSSSGYDTTVQNGEANNNNENDVVRTKQAAPSPFPRRELRYNRNDGKVKLDANDNQVPLATNNQQEVNRGQQYRNSPSRGLQNSMNDFPGRNMTPPKTFQELKNCYRQLEEASDDDIRKEARDEVMTLRGDQRKTSKLTRSNTTMGVARRPSSGRTPRPILTDIHYRQHSEPVELFQHLSTRNTSSPVNDSQPPLCDSNIYHQQNFAVRDELRQKLTRRPREQHSGIEHILTQDPRAGSSGSCDSSLSIVSIESSAQHPQDPFCKLPDSISHVSSEEWLPDDRESSPSPHSTSHRSCSSDDNMTPLRHEIKRPQRHCAMSALANESWQQRPSPLASNKTRQDTVDVVAPLAQLPQGVQLQTEVSPRRKSSDLDTTSRSKIDPTLKFRHHSDNSCEDATPIITKLLTNGNIMSPNHKPLERSATTGCEPNKKDLDRHLGRVIEPVSPIKNSKKMTSRSHSGPSPRKGKKSPEGLKSPRTPHLGHQRSTLSMRCMNGVPHYDKEHEFKSHTYRGLQWCEYCGNFMWGIIQQGMQCRDCGLNVHKQCSKLVPWDCQPALKHVKAVFGIDLTALVKLHGTERPIVLDKCIEEIEFRGMNSEGIYRVSGLHDDIQELKLSFDRHGHDVDLSQFDDINIVAGGLKLYLRELPVPLIPYNLYSRFMNAAKLSNADGKLEAICRALDAMPPAHFQTLKHLINHLGRVCDPRACNQMDSHNLGIVFGPTMLRAPEKDAVKSRLDDVQFQREIISNIIDNRVLLFRQQAFENQIHS